MEYVRCDVGEGPRFAFADPLRERDSEDGGARLCREGGRRLAGAASAQGLGDRLGEAREFVLFAFPERGVLVDHGLPHAGVRAAFGGEQRCGRVRSEEHTSELQSQSNLVCRLLLEKKKKKKNKHTTIKKKKKKQNNTIISKN